MTSFPKKILAILVLSQLIVLCAFAQGNPSGKVSGRITSAGEAIPGVRISIESDSLLQPRQVFSQAGGDYLVNALPPGTYRLTFHLEGFDPATRQTAVSIAQTTYLDVDLDAPEFADIVDVVADSTKISESATASTTLTQDFIDKLPTGRSINSIVTLAPGTANTGPSNNLSISGAQSFDNLYLINGVPVMENLRGQASTLFIEDAIAETTVSSAGVSAEYSRFTGGVINTVTKSGGNQLSGSLRSSITNDDWTSVSPFGETRLDDINQRYEATLGGRLIKDRIWFFAAARSVDNSVGGSTSFSNIPFDTSQEESRIEGKLTASITASHEVQLSVLEIEDDRTGNVQGAALDLGAVNDNVSFPEESFAAHYTGILTDKLLIEAQYSERSLQFNGIGGLDSNLLTGTPFRDASRGAAVYHQPLFCGNCPNPTTRETEHAIVKGSLFLPTEKTGSHDLIFGIDTFNDIISGDNVQSATNFAIWSSNVIIRGSDVFPVLIPGANAFILSRPILESSLGTDFVSNGLYVNDTWRYDDRWSFNLGLRFDQNDGVDSAGNAIADDSYISPRLGASYDWKGDGSLLLRATTGRYVTRLANGVANGGSAAGRPAFFGWSYFGPGINLDPNTADPVTAEEALTIIFNWFDSIGGVNAFADLGTNIPGATSRIDGSLDSPNVEEFTLGFTQRLGSRGLVRADYIRREFGNFYFQRTDTSTGTIVDPNGVTQDLTLIQNDDSVLERVYDGLQTSFRYRLNSRWDVGGNWTWSHARGNFNGETVRTGPVSGTVGQYPEFKAFAQNNPRRDLSIDRRHTARAWLLFDAIQTEHHSLDISLLQSFFSGTPYGAAGGVDSSPFVDDPGYQSPPGSNGVTYWFTAPNAFKTDDISRTDLTLNYSFGWTLGGKALEIFVQPEVINVFDADGVTGVNTFVQDATSAAGFEAFNPFTDTPIQGVHWDFGSTFGQPTNSTSYQTPRTFRMSVGLRF